jgi:hypothetical protein
MPILVEHKEILSTQSESKTLLEWVKFFDSRYTKSQIYSFCYHNGYKIKKISQSEKDKIQSQNARKYHINQDYFKTWSSNMAYVLGLWFADGCIYNDRMFDITLHAKDKYILKQVAKELAYEGKLYDYVDRQASRINFSCVVIYRDIVSLGGTENKSLTVKFPIVPDKYLADFIRGYFDGNGCIMNLKGGRINTAFTCGSKEFLDDLLEILTTKANVKGGSYDASCLSLKFGKRDSIRIGEFMYKNNPELFLLRKRKKFPINNL